MEKELTIKMLEDARDYLPDAVKEAWVTENASKCFDRLAITADGEAVPPMYMPNSSLKARYLMGAFVGLYLGLDFEAENEENLALMSVAEYDRWAGSHIFNQVERMKRFMEIRDKCFDILADYRDLEKRFHAVIGSLLAVQNDSVIRQNELTSAAVKELPEIMKQLESLQKKEEK